MRCTSAAIGDLRTSLPGNEFEGEDLQSVLAPMEQTHLENGQHFWSPPKLSS